MRYRVIELKLAVEVGFIDPTACRIYTIARPANLYPGLLGSLGDCDLLECVLPDHAGWPEIVRQ
jgi:hypothetical protein